MFLDANRTQFSWFDRESHIKQKSRHLATLGRQRHSRSALACIHGDAPKALRILHRLPSRASISPRKSGSPDPTSNRANLFAPIHYVASYSRHHSFVVSPPIGNRATAAPGRKASSWTQILIHRSAFDASCLRTGGSLRTSSSSACLLEIDSRRSAQQFGLATATVTCPR